MIKQISRDSIHNPHIYSPKHTKMSFGPYPLTTFTQNRVYRVYRPGYPTSLSPGMASLIDYKNCNGYQKNPLVNTNSNNYSNSNSNYFNSSSSMQNNRSTCTNTKSCSMARVSAI